MVRHLDLDTIAWKESGERESLDESLRKLELFLTEYEQWVVEGCYSPLIAQAALQANELVLLNPGIEACQANCKSRPWEPHKYPSKAEQDKNLAMLLNWVADYELREDEFSYAEHRKIFEAFSGNKQEIKSTLEAHIKAKAHTPAAAPHHETLIAKPPLP